MSDRFSLVRRSLLMSAIFIFLVSCAKDPYEVEIERFYFETMNRSVSIVKVTVDTTVTFELAKPWLEKKLERVKERMKISYAEAYDQARSAPKPDPVLDAQLKARLDSANAGLFSVNNHEIKSFSDFITSKPSFEQITLNYKTWVQGEVMEQVFIRKLSSKDTTLSVTEKGIKEYLMY